VQRLSSISPANSSVNGVGWPAAAVARSWQTV
jgi:hypothetical protein